MFPLRCCSFNCRGWNSGYLTLKNQIDSLDLCFVQEHWLHHDHLHKIREISPDFLSVSVSAMNNSVLLSGRPYGGYSILYRKSLGISITPLSSCSDRFCGIKLCDSSGLSILIICVYMPAICFSRSSDEYLYTLGELERYISVQQCDASFLFGDFNVDFGRGGSLSSLLSVFISEHNLCARDLSFSNHVQYTYERGDGLARSWIDHILCTNTHAHLVTDVYVDHSDCTLSDHYLLHFFIQANCLPPVTTLSCSYSSAHHTIDWDKASASDIAKFR